MGWNMDKRKQMGNRKEIKDMNRRWRPSLRKFGRQSVEKVDWRMLGDDTFRMLSTLEAIVEKVAPEKVEYNGWVIYFRETLKDEARSFGKSSGEDLNPSGENETAERFRPKSRRLPTLRRNAAIERLCLVNEKFHDAGKSSEVLRAEGKNMKLVVKNDKTRFIERLTGRMEEEYNLKNNNVASVEKKYSQEEPKLVDVIAEVDETLGQELKPAKKEDKMIEDDDVMQGVMEEEKAVGMEPTVIEEDNESRSERSAAEAAEHLCVVVDDEAEDRRAVSDDEDEAAGDRRVVSDDKEEEHEGKEVFVQVVATGDSTRNRLREWRNEMQVLKDKAARKENDEMQEAWRKKNDDFMKKCENKKNKKKTGRLKICLHDKTIKGILSQTLF